jgi:uncharacterized membrane protein YkvA (DUF1232 family)
VERLTASATMPVQITFELSDGDLEYFRTAMREAQRKLPLRDEAAILSAARHLARQTLALELPAFVEERLLSLDTLTRMLEDEDWKLDGSYRERVLQALAYFAEPSDLVPDQIPGLGFLDDAIMVELVVQELRPELDAYAIFGAQRDEERARLGIDPAETQRRIQEKRRAMYARMQDRREERARRGGTFSIFN